MQPMTWGAGCHSFSIYLLSPDLRKGEFLKLREF